MKKKYFVELYYYKDDVKNLGLKDIPNLDDYKPETKMTNVVSGSWDDAKNKLLLDFPDIAYILVHETKNIDI